MINIGIDGHMLGDRSGGNESFYSNILLNMEIPKGTRIFLFVKTGVDVSKYADKFEVVYFKSKNAIVRNFWELTMLSKKYKLDVLHVQYFIPIFRPCKVVCTIYDICFEHFKDIFTRKEYYRQKILIPYAAKHSERVFTVSNHAKNDIIKHYCVKNNNVLVTYCAVSAKFRQLTSIELNNQELRMKYNIGSSKYVLSVCNLQPRKNLVRLIRSFISMKKDFGGEEKLVIVGKKAWMFNDILKTAIDGSKDIVFTDYVEGDDLIRLYNEASCFVYPSLFEGFGIPPLEAMACGTPVAVANTTSLPEVVGDAGLYFDPYSEDQIKHSMTRLLNDSELCLELKQKGFQQASKFSWKKSSELLTSTYLQVVKNK